jgi:hypothetical protein
VVEDDTDEPGWYGTLGDSLFETEKDAHDWRRGYFHRRAEFYAFLETAATHDWRNCGKD